MGAGNKEAAKALLDASRVIVSISMAVLLIMTNLYARDLLPHYSETKFYLSVALLSISIISAISLHLIIIPKLVNETEEIVYKCDVVFMGSISLAAFFFAIGLILANSLVH